MLNCRLHTCAQVLRRAHRNRESFDLRNPKLAQKSAVTQGPDRRCFAIWFHASKRESLSDWASGRDALEELERFEHWDVFKF